MKRKVESAFWLCEHLDRQHSGLGRQEGGIPLWGEGGVGGWVCGGGKGGLVVDAQLSHLEFDSLVMSLVVSFRSYKFVASLSHLHGTC